MTTPQESRRGRKAGGRRRRRAAPRGRARGGPGARGGPDLPEGQGGTVREDYSHDGDAWKYFSHDQARSRAYRWGEDGIAGYSTTAAAVLRAGPVERPGPDPQGAPLRPHEH